MSAPEFRELEAWRTGTAGELREYAYLLVAKAEAARKAADILEPPRRKRRRRRRKTANPTPAKALEQVEQVGESLAAVREGARRAGVRIE